MNKPNVLEVQKHLVDDAIDRRRAARCIYQAPQASQIVLHESPHLVVRPVPNRIRWRSWREQAYVASRPGHGFTVRADALERFRHVGGPEFQF